MYKPVYLKSNCCIISTDLKNADPIKKISSNQKEEQGIVRISVIVC